MIVKGAKGFWAAPEEAQRIKIFLRGIRGERGAEVIPSEQGVLTIRKRNRSMSATRIPAVPSGKKQ